MKVEYWLLLYIGGMIDVCRCCTQCFHEKYANLIWRLQHLLILYWSVKSNQNTTNTIIPVYADTSKQTYHPPLLFSDVMLTHLLSTCGDKMVLQQVINVSSSSPQVLWSYSGDFPPFKSAWGCSSLLVK